MMRDEDIGAIISYGTGEKLEVPKDVAADLKLQISSRWAVIGFPKVIQFGNYTAFVNRINYIQWFI